MWPTLFWDGADCVMLSGEDGQRVVPHSVGADDGGDMFVGGGSYLLPSFIR